VATIPSYVTWVAGTVVTAAALNSQVRDPGNFYLARPYCNMFNNTGVACTNGTATLIPFDTEIEDNDSMHSTVTNPSRMIFNTPGVYLIIPRLSFPSTGTGGRIINLRLNSAGSNAGGTSLLNTTGTPNASNAIGDPTHSWFYRAANVGDYMEFFATQSSGGSQTTVTGTLATGIQAMWQIA